MKWGDYKASGAFLDAAVAQWSADVVRGSEAVLFSGSVTNFGTAFGSMGGSPSVFTFSVAGFYMVLHNIDVAVTTFGNSSLYTALRKTISGTRTYLDVTRGFVPVTGTPWAQGGGVQFQQFGVGDIIDAVGWTDDPSPGLHMIATATILRLRASGAAD